MSGTTKLKDAILVLIDEQASYQRSLEEYLRSLWAVVHRSRDVPVTEALLVTILRDAFSVEPPPFQADWLAYQQPLDWTYQDTGYVWGNMLFEDGQPILHVGGTIDSFAILHHTLLFQIADLYRMRDQQAHNPLRAVGVISPTGNSWYNFDVYSYLECAVAGMDSERIAAFSSSEWDWVDLACLLELGRLYE